MKAPAKISPSNFALKNELCGSFSAPKSCATVTGGGDGAIELSVTGLRAPCAMTVSRVRSLADARTG